MILKYNAIPHHNFCDVQEYKIMKFSFNKQFTFLPDTFLSFSRRSKRYAFIYY